MPQKAFRYRGGTGFRGESVAAICMARESLATGDRSVAAQAGVPATITVHSYQSAGL